MRDSKREIRLQHCFDMTNHYLNKMADTHIDDTKSSAKSYKAFRLWRRKYQQLVREVEYLGKK